VASDEENDRGDRAMTEPVNTDFGTDGDMFIGLFRRVIQKPEGEK
jgi:hypothetical protein